MQGRCWAVTQVVQKKHPMKCAGVAGRRVRAPCLGLRCTGIALVLDTRSRRLDLPEWRL